MSNKTEEFLNKIFDMNKEIVSKKTEAVKTLLDKLDWSFSDGTEVVAVEDLYIYPIKGTKTYCAFFEEVPEEHLEKQGTAIPELAYDVVTQEYADKKGYVFNRLLSRRAQENIDIIMFKPDKFEAVVLSMLNKIKEHIEEPGQHVKAVTDLKASVKLEDIYLDIFLYTNILVREEIIMGKCKSKKKK